jgi:hypothetical protein
MLLAHLQQQVQACRKGQAPVVAQAFLVHGKL